MRIPVLLAASSLSLAMPALAARGLEISLLEVPGVAAKFDLTLSCTETDRGLAASLEYNADLFDGETAERLLTHLETLLGSALAETDRPVGGLPMLSDDEQRTLDDWGGDEDEPLSDELSALLDGLDDEPHETLTHGS